MKISQIIDKINEHHLFVPAFQREYVWKKKDAKNLVDSLINDYPTGTMLTWETTNPPELKGEYVYEVSKGAVKLILDGQQRITTLYMLMTGKIPPYYTEKEILSDIRGLYVNVESRSLEYYRKTVMEQDPTWVDITEIFKGNVRTRDIIDALEEKNKGERLPREKENKIDDNIESIKRIREREFLEQVIPAKASIKEAIDIFYIVNSSGVNLTDAELALAQISGYWPKAREEFKTKLDNLKSKGWIFSLDFIVYTLLATIHRQGSKMEKLHTADNKEKIKETWRKLDGGILDYTFNLLQSQAYIDHTNEINSVYALIPIITYVYLKPNHKLNENEIKTASIPFHNLIFNSSIIQKTSTITLILIVSTLSLSLFPQSKLDNIKSRFQVGVQNATSAFGNERREPNSTGIRLDMWEASLVAISDHPLTGIGPGTHTTYFPMLEQSGRININTAPLVTFDHMHNDYIQAWLSMGVIFGTLSFAFILCFLILFASKAKNTYSSLAGISVCSSFILCGLTDVPAHNAASLTLFLIIASLQLSYLQSYATSSLNKNSAGQN